MRPPPRLRSSRIAFTDATKCGTIPFDASSSDYAEQNDAERSNDSTRSTLMRHSSAFDIVVAMSHSA
jgi:hypothetical protein